MLCKSIEVPLNKLSGTLGKTYRNMDLRLSSLIVEKSSNYDKNCGRRLMASDPKLCYFTLHSPVRERAVTMKRVGKFF